MIRAFLVLGVIWTSAQSVALAAQSPVNLAGDWITEITPKTPKPQVLSFGQHGDTWTGTMTSAFGTIELKDILVREGQVSFSEYFTGGFGPLAPTRVQGIFRGDELRLKIQTYRTVDRVARRTDDHEAIAAIQKSTPKNAPLKVLTDNGLARTPPMGWNSWNHFELNIDDRAVREVADALVDTGLRDAGYVYVNIDDGWQGARDAQGELHPNSRFPDMKALADYVHSRGLKFGLYSSPGPRTCAGFEGSFNHEDQDAKTFASWGVDYLKYDWCSANYLYSTATEMQAAYRKMGAALQASGRPMVFSLCQYGMFDVGRWGHAVGGNLWRTTYDILDYWSRMAEIGFAQDGREVDAAPGGWNDPDMLEIGNGGMSADEYRTHLALWAILSAPLLLGNDVRAMTPEARALLSNKDVIAIDQDVLGSQGRRVIQTGSIEVWSKSLADGAVAVAVFNRGDVPADADVHWQEIGLFDPTTVRDLWDGTDLPAKAEGYHASLPPHGAMLLRVGWQ